MMINGMPFKEHEAKKYRSYLENIMITSITSNTNSNIVGTTYDPHRDQYGVFGSHGVVGSISPLTINAFEEVKGEMILVEKVMDPSIEILPDKKQIKKEFIEKLVQKILESNLVEFTRQDDFKTGLVTFRARAYLTPDEKIRVLRKS